MRIVPHLKLKTFWVHRIGSVYKKYDVDELFTKCIN